MMVKQPYRKRRTALWAINWTTGYDKDSYEFNEDAKMIPVQERRNVEANIVLWWIERNKLCEESVIQLITQPTDPV
jgi:hypothetical protein